MEKPILIFYFNSTDFPDNPEEYSEYIHRIKRSMLKNDEVLSYLICGKDVETRVECINPRLVQGDEYLKVKEILDRNQEIVDNLMKENEDKK